MGIPGFFAWIRKRCPFVLQKVGRYQTVAKELSKKSISRNFNNPKETKETNESQPVGNLCLDMNGIIHEAAQKIFKYGSHKQLESKIHSNRTFPFPVMKKRMFLEIGKIIDNLVDQIKPNKRLLIMVDGPAGKSKRAQQRSRRYRSAQDTEKKFDTNAISPGTELMDHLSKYLDYHIRLRITQDLSWSKLQVIYSSHQVPGEGEHKLLSFIRKFCDSKESFVLYGLDADLIMLCLSIQNRLSIHSEIPPFWIVREDQYEPGLFILDISLFREWLISELTWGMDCSRTEVIDDFIFVCFLLGNDFLPHSPSVDLLDGGIELLFSSYVLAGEKHQAHLITQTKDNKKIPVFSINTKVFKELLFQLTLTEKSLLEESIKKDVFADPLLQKYITVSLNEEQDEKKGKTILNYDGYREEFYKTKLSGTTSAQVCHDFFRGMEWVFYYYTLGIPSWDWMYPYAYSPFAKEMFEHIDIYQSKPFVLGKPITPFLQLLTILPPQSKDLLPKPLDSLLDGLPTEIKLDLAGKKFDWQAVVILPDLPEKLLEEQYNRLINHVDSQIRKRDSHWSEYIYVYDASKNYPFKSYYGTFDSAAKVVMLRE